MKNTKLTNTILFVLSLFLLQTYAFAEDYRVDIMQGVLQTNGKYAVGGPSAQVSFSVLPKGRLNLLYKFELNTDDDESDNEFIRCVIKSQGSSFEVIAFDGVQNFKFGEDQESAILEQDDYAEFLIPVRHKWKGFIEIQVTVSADDIGNDLPIDISFDGYRRPISSYFFFSSTKSIQDKISDKEITSSEDAVEYVKIEYNPFFLSGSLKHYTIQVVE